MFAFATAALLVAIAQDPAPRGETRTAPAFEIELRANALVRGLDLTLGDLAEVRPEGQDAATIGAIKLGAAPMPGVVRQITRNEFLQALVANGYSPASFKIRGAVESTVQSMVVSIGQSEFVNAATIALQAVLQQEGGDVEYELAAPLRALQVQPGRVSQDLRARVRGGATSPASAVVDVEVLVDGVAAKTVAVQWKLSRFHQVLKTTQAVAAGIPLGPENCVMSRERVSQTQGLYITSIEQAVGTIAKRNLQPSQLLMLTDVGQPALIHRGDIVTVVLTKGRVKIETRGVANNDAGRGETVTVTSASTRAQLTGVAEASGTVVVRN